MHFSSLSSVELIQRRAPVSGRFVIGHLFDLTYFGLKVALNQTHFPSLI